MLSLVDSPIAENSQDKTIDFVIWPTPTEVLMLT